MPGGGPDASWVDRRLQTERLEYLDRDDVDDRVKRQIVGSLETLGSLLNDHEKFARLPARDPHDAENRLHKALEALGHGRTDGLFTGREWFVTDLATLDTVASSLRLKTEFRDNDGVAMKPA